MLKMHMIICLLRKKESLNYSLFLEYYTKPNLYGA